MEQMHDWQRLTEIPGKEKTGEHTGCNEAITFGKEMNNKEGTILSIKGERLILMPLNRKVILDWDTAQRSYNLSLPAEGDVDESQDWWVENGQARTNEVDTDRTWWEDTSATTSCFYGDGTKWRPHSAIKLSICNTLLGGQWKAEAA